MDANKIAADALVKALGQRLQRERLNQDFTQADIAKQVGVSRRSVMNAEKGQATLATFVGILQALNRVDQLDNFLPEPSLSPVQLAKLQGKKRRRASGTSSNNGPTSSQGNSPW